MFRVKGSTVVGSMAGKIAHEVRAGRQPILLTMGQESINQAIKVSCSRFTLQYGMASIS
jgi:stage V sporulation protein SpoVS